MVVHGITTLSDPLRGKTWEQRPANSDTHPPLDPHRFAANRTVSPRVFRRCARRSGASGGAPPRWNRGLRCPAKRREMLSGDLSRNGGVARCRCGEGREAGEACSLTPALCLLAESKNPKQRLVTDSEPCNLLLQSQPCGVESVQTLS